MGASTIGNQDPLSLVYIRQVFHSSSASPPQFPSAILGSVTTMAPYLALCLFSLRLAQALALATQKVLAVTSTAALATSSKGPDPAGKPGQQGQMVNFDQIWSSIMDPTSSGTPILRSGDLLIRLPELDYSDSRDFRDIGASALNESLP